MAGKRSIEYFDGIVSEVAKRLHGMGFHAWSHVNVESLIRDVFEDAAMQEEEALLLLAGAFHYFPDGLEAEPWTLHRDQRLVPTIWEVCNPFVYRKAIQDMAECYKQERDERESAVGES